MSSFSDRLSLLRSKRNLSQNELSSRLNIAKSTLAMYETGKREPSFEITEKIADFFDTNIDYLLGRTDDPYPMGYESKIDPEWAELHEKLKQKGAELHATAILRTASQMTVRQLEDILRVFEMIEKDKGKGND